MINSLKEEERHLHDVLRLYESGELYSKDGNHPLRNAINERDDKGMKSAIDGYYGFKDVESPLAKFIAR